MRPIVILSSTVGQCIKIYYFKHCTDAPQALEMIHNLREAFNEILAENSWMDQETKAVAKQKVHRAQ